MLEIQNLKVSYGEIEILCSLDLHLAEGETVALIGESGAGKTTLGMSIMRLLDADCEGCIRFRDEPNLLELTDRDMNAIRWNRISMVFQNVNNVLNPVHRIIDQVAEPVIAHGLKKSSEVKVRAGELLESFGIPRDRFGAYPHELSGGEQQRVLLAMACSNDPELVILDEPLSSLDVTTRNEISELLAENHNDCTRLIITHDLDTARRLADRVAVLYGGRIVEIGPTSHVLNRPRHPYTRALIRSFPNMTTVKDLQGIKGRMTRPVSGCPFHLRCTQAIDSCGRDIPELIYNGDRGIACHRGGIVTILSVSDLTKLHDSDNGIRSVSLKLDSGEILALVGQSGSGKTTLAAAVMGRYEASAGSVLFEGQARSAMGKEFYRRVQLISQNPGDAISHRLTVLDAVMEPLEIQNIGSKEERREKGIRTLGEVELPREDYFLQAYPHNLSGGELQRVAIARALVLDPDLLIADEPTAFLDASVGAKVLKLLLNLQEQRGLSMIYITHDIAAARKVSDRIAVMLNGRIVEEGSSSDIVTLPQQEYTRQLLASAARL